MDSLAEAPYLVALALVEFDGKRALPLTGKSQSAAAADAVDPGDDGRTLALELLLRLWQRSEEGPLTGPWGGQPAASRTANGADERTVAAAQGELDLRR